MHIPATPGIHLIKHAAYRTVERGAQFMLLGAAPDPKVQGEFDELSSAMTGENAKFAFAFDEPLSHLIYAAADIVLVPSMFEPCGLTQLIAMRCVWATSTTCGCGCCSCCALALLHAPPGGARCSTAYIHHMPSTPVNQVWWHSCGAVNWRLARHGV